MKFELDISWMSGAPYVRTANIDGVDYQLLAGILPGELKITSATEDYNTIIKLRKQLDSIGVDTTEMIFGVLAKESKTQLAAFVTQWIEEDGIRKDVFIVSQLGLKAKGTIVHEATHLLQMASGRLVPHPEKVVWEGVDYSGHSDGSDPTRILEYLRQPWELEAYKAQWASSKVSKILPFKAWFTLNYTMPYGIVEWIMKRKKK